MKNQTKIVLATEFSATCEVARAHAEALARAVGAELHVLFVDVPAGEYEAWDPAYRVLDSEPKEASVSEARMADYVRDLDLPVVSSVVHNVDAGDAILDYAELKAADFIVVGTHARRGIKRLLLGSVAGKVVRNAKVPVLVVGPDQAPAESGFRHLLVATDYSESAAMAARHAYQFACRSASQVTLLHVIDERQLPSYFRDLMLGSARGRARAAMDKLIEGFEGGPSLDKKIQLGLPADVIAECAEDIDADLIVMASSGMNALERVVLGSTAAQLLREAPCPVLVYPHVVSDVQIERKADQLPVI